MMQFVVSFVCLYSYLFFYFVYLLSFIVACHQVNDDKFFADFSIPPNLSLGRDTEIGIQFSLKIQI